MVFVACELVGDVELVPKGCERVAGREEDDGEGGDEDADDSDVDPGRDAEGAWDAARVEAPVEEEDGDFDEPAREDVKEVDGEDNLALGNVEVGCHVPNVAVEAVNLGCYLFMLV